MKKKAEITLRDLLIEERELRYLINSLKKRLMETSLRRLKMQRGLGLEITDEKEK